MASERKARKASKGSGTDEVARSVQEERVARAKMPQVGDPGVDAPGTQRGGPDIETEEANLQSTYEWGGRLYGPGERLLVPKGLADQLNVKLPRSEIGFAPASGQIESREDAAHPAVGHNPPKQGAGIKEGRQR